MPGPMIGVHTVRLSDAMSEGHLSNGSPPGVTPGVYQRRPLFSRMNRVGLHQSCRSRTVARATAIARSTSPSSSRLGKNAGVDAAAGLLGKVALHTTTAGERIVGRRG